jgi:drug/metabolite transporter (DMT)-like permease
MQSTVLLLFFFTMVSGTVMSVALKYLAWTTPSLVNGVSGLLFGVISLIIRFYQKQVSPTIQPFQRHRAMLALGIALLGVNMWYSFLYGQKIPLAYVPIIVTAGMTIVLWMIWHFFFHEPMTWKFGIGTLCILTGMWVIAR